jgi:D-alanine-D-alanine ligase
MTRRLRVGVLFGGRSVEHDVSLVSARSVMAAIDPERFEVVPIGITRGGKWLPPARGRDPLALLAESAGTGSGRLEAEGVPAGLPVPAEREDLAGPDASTGRLDIVFPLVHGIYGEDGTMQGLLEMADLPYVGSGVLGSAVGMDKEIAKILFTAAGLTVVPGEAVRQAGWTADRSGTLARLSGRYGWPCFVKPAGSGSSVGVSKVRAAADLPAALDLAFRYDRKVLVEQAVDAREIEVAVLGNDAPEASVCGEIVPCHEFYDYDAKYHSESTLLVPAPLPDETAAGIRAAALAAFRALDLSGLARVDFFLDRTSGRYYLNEVNTLPGFTPVSMYPRLWEASGLAYRDLISRLIDLGLERHLLRRALDTTFIPEGKGT